MLLFLFLVSLLSFPLRLRLSSSMSDNEVNCNYCSTTIAYSRECTPLKLDSLFTDAMPMKKMSLATMLEELHWKIRSQWWAKQWIRSWSRPTSSIESLVIGKTIGAITCLCSIRRRCLDAVASFSPSLFKVSAAFYHGIFSFIVSRLVNRIRKEISHCYCHFQYFVCCKFLGDDSDLYRQHFLSFCALAALLAALVSTGFGLFISFQ